MISTRAGIYRFGLEMEARVGIEPTYLFLVSCCQAQFHKLLKNNFR